LQIAATVAYRAAAVRHLVRHSQSGGRPDWSDTDKPLRAAPKLKPPALPGDTYFNLATSAVKPEKAPERIRYGLDVKVASSGIDGVYC